MSQFGMTRLPDSCVQVFGATAPLFSSHGKVLWPGGAVAAVHSTLAARRPVVLAAPVCRSQALTAYVVLRWTRLVRL